MRLSPICAGRLVRLFLPRMGFCLGTILGMQAPAQFPDAPRDPLPPLPERRAAILKAFDRDGDGRLGDVEREVARKAWAASQMVPRRDRGFFQPPPEIMAEFDADKDGDLSDDEGRKAMETMGRRIEQMRKDYDANANGTLDDDEIAAASRDIDAGKLKGIPKMFVQFAAGRRPGGPRHPGGGEGTGDGAGGDDPQALLRAADRDGDGRLSAEELDRIRADRARRRGGAPGAGGAKDVKP